MKKITSQQLKEETAEYLKNHRITKGKSITRFKTYKKAYSSKLNPCPECGSHLVVDVTGVILCSQDRLKEWYSKCLVYDNGDEKTRLEILKNDVKNQFFHLYDRWKQKDANGNRSVFNCMFSNRLHSPVPNYNWWITDSFQVRRLEKILNRSLAQAELEGIVKVRYTDKKGNSVEESVIRYRYPWDLI